MTQTNQRDAFWNRIYELAKENRNMIVISADMGAPMLDKFRKDLLSQFVNVGIAEQNATNIATGLTLTGKKVFTYAIAPFITLRCLEQIRVQSGIMNIPITIVGVGAGFGYEDSGPTHHLIEDIAIMRSIPHITIHNITDNVMASAFADISCKMKNTNYVRLDRQTFPDIYTKNSDFSKGLSILKESNEYYIISTGSMTHTALEISKRFEDYINIGVIDIYQIPINENILIDIIKDIKKIITLEEHFLPGGLGSAICEILGDNNLFIPIKRIGIDITKSYCYKYGGRQIIREYYGIDNSNIEKEMKKFLVDEKKINIDRNYENNIIIP